jgi:hypothetical protein
MQRPVTVACVQAEPVILDLEGTLDRLETLAAEAARNGAGLVVFPKSRSSLRSSRGRMCLFAAGCNNVV